MRIIEIGEIDFKSSATDTILLMSQFYNNETRRENGNYIRLHIHQTTLKEKPPNTLIQF